MKLKFTVLFFSISMSSFSQSDGLDKVLKAGEILVNGFAVIKNGKSQNNNSAAVENFCVSNKLNEKITFKLSSDEGEDKELIIPSNGKECLFNVDKGVWKYEVILPNNETYKKGEYNISENETIVLKE